MDEAIGDLIKQGDVTDPNSARGRLLNKAAKLFCEKGFQQTTVRDLAKAIGIQSGSLFHHFKSKEAILKAVMVETIKVTTALQVKAVEKETDPIERLRALIYSELHAIHGPTRSALSILVSEWRSLSPENQKEALILRQDYDDLWIDVLKDVHKAGRLAPGSDPVVVRRLITGMLGWTAYWYNEKGKMPLPALVDYCLNMLVHEK